MLPVLEKQEKGTAILDVSSFKEPLLIDIPYTTVDDLVLMLQGNEQILTLSKTFGSSNIIDSNN